MLLACSSPAGPKPFANDLDTPLVTSPSLGSGDLGPHTTSSEGLDGVGTSDTVNSTSRVRGSVKGNIAPERSVYLAGEPIFVVFEVTNTGMQPVEFDTGGDFGPALFPQRFTYVVRDEKDHVLCETAKQSPPPQGGGGVRAHLDPNKSWRELHTATPVCAALQKPGRYRLTISRVLTIAMNKCDEISLPDMTALPAGAKDPYGKRDAACMTALASLPAIATDSTIEVKPWDAKRLREKLLYVTADRSNDASRQGAIAAYGQWYCERVRCDCPDDVRYARVDDWLEQALGVVPDVLGDCR